MPALITGGLAAVIASACCLDPLVLLALGVSTAGVGTLARLEPYRPVLIGVAVLSLYFAHRRIFRPVEKGEPGEVCANSAVNHRHRALFWIAVGILVVAFASPFVSGLFS